MERTDISPDVLVIEDNPTDAELMREVFEQHIPTERIQVVRDGAQALDLIHGTGRFRGDYQMCNLRLIVVDLKLPFVDGLYVLRQMFTDPRTRMIPKVVLTSSCEFRDIYSTYSLGANSYVVKPVNSDHFIGKIRAVASYWLSINEAPKE